MIYSTSPALYTKAPIHWCILRIYSNDAILLSWREYVSARPTSKTNNTLASQQAADTGFVTSPASLCRVVSCKLLSHGLDWAAMGFTVRDEQDYGMDEWVISRYITTCTPTKPRYEKPRLLLSYNNLQSVRIQICTSAFVCESDLSMLYIAEGQNVDMVSYCTGDVLTGFQLRTESA